MKYDTKVYFAMEKNMLTVFFMCEYKDIVDTIQWNYIKGCHIKPQGNSIEMLLVNIIHIKIEIQNYFHYLIVE